MSCAGAWAGLRVGCGTQVSRHRSHFGSRYTLGCCGHAGLLRPGSNLAPGGVAGVGGRSVRGPGGSVRRPGGRGPEPGGDRSAGWGVGPPAWGPVRGPGGSVRGPGGQSAGVGCQPAGLGGLSPRAWGGQSAGLHIHYTTSHHIIFYRIIPLYYRYIHDHKYTPYKDLHTYYKYIDI